LSRYILPTQPPTTTEFANSLVTDPETFQDLNFDALSSGLLVKDPPQLLRTSVVDRQQVASPNLPELGTAHVMDYPTEPIVLTTTQLSVENQIKTSEKQVGNRSIQYKSCFLKSYFLKGLCFGVWKI
jgi:hypothetical protein